MGNKQTTDLTAPTNRGNLAQRHNQSLYTKTNREKSKINRRCSELRVSTINGNIPTICSASSLTASFDTPSTNGN